MVLGATGDSVSRDGPPFICAEGVLRTPIEECGEGLVDLRESNILTDPAHQRVGHRGERQFHCRREVSRRLFYAQMSLPFGYQLLVLECHRPVELQAEYWERELARLGERYPEWSEQRLREVNARYIAPPDDTPPHSTGGALDLTLVDSDGEELQMGHPVNDRGPGAHTKARDIPPEARDNRQVLQGALRQFGFVNYGYAWWHFSYGDRYWAYLNGEPAAHYGTV